MMIVNKSLLSCRQFFTVILNYTPFGVIYTQRESLVHITFGYNFNVEGNIPTINGIFMPEEDVDVYELWFQPDYVANETVNILKETFVERIISHREPAASSLGD